MASTLVTARQTAETIVAGLTPLDEAGITYRRAPRHVLLEEMPLSSSPRENTRTFQIRLVPRFQEAEANSLNGLGRGELEIVILYHVPHGLDTEGAVRLTDLASSDVAHICSSLRVPLTTTWNVGVVNVTPDGDPTLVRRNDADDVWILTQSFEILYCVETT